MDNIRLSSKNLLGIILFFFIALGSFLKVVTAVSYVDDDLVIRMVQLVMLFVLMIVIHAFLKFEPYNT